MPMPMDWMWQTMGLGMLLVWLFVVAAIVAGIVLLARAVRGPGGDNPERGHTEALRILEERFARGEIDRDEFEERRRTLRS
jgi:putative membrane protein